MEKAEVNSKVLTIKGKAELEKLLDVGHDYILGVKVHCTQVAKDDKPNNGSFDMICRTALLGELVIESDLGKKFYAKTKGTPSQQQRWMMDRIGMDYDRDMAKIRRHSEEFKEFVNNLD